MDTILAVLMLCILLASLWDIRRGQRITHELVERIAQLVAEVLRRTPAP